MTKQKFLFQIQNVYPFVREAQLYGVVLRGWLLKGGLPEVGMLGVPLKDGSIENTRPIALGVMTEDNLHSRYASQIAASSGTVHCEILVRAHKGFTPSDINITGTIECTYDDGT